MPEVALAYPTIAKAIEKCRRTGRCLLVAARGKAEYDLLGYANSYGEACEALRSHVDKFVDDYPEWRF